MKIEKLTKTEFFDVYGISLILACNTVKESTKKYLVELLSPIAQKYLDITLHAVRTELRYFRRGSHSKGDYAEIKPENLDLLKELGISNWKAGRNKVSFVQASRLFYEGEWERHIYGGEAWGDIADEGELLRTLLPVTVSSLKKVVNAIDRLNDLEHNNSLYLAQYSTFDLLCALEFKMECNSKALIEKCSKDIRDIYREEVVQ